LDENDTRLRENDIYSPVSEKLSDWIYHSGIRAAGWATAAIANSWILEEGVFDDMSAISVPTLILLGMNDENKTSSELTGNRK